VMVGLSSAEVLLWSACRDGEKQHTVSHFLGRDDDFEFEVSSIACSDQCACAGTDDGRVFVLRLPELQLLHKLGGKRDGAIPLSSVKYCSAGDLLAAGYGNPLARIWDESIDSDSAITTMVWKMGSQPELIHCTTATMLRSVCTVEFVRVRGFRGQQEVTLLGCGTQDGIITLWDVHTQQCIRTLRGHKPSEWVCSIAASAAGDTVISAGGNPCNADHVGSIRFW
jgi:WD40 repeat protein